MEVDFSEAKVRVLNLIDKWSDEIIKDLIIDIQKAADIGSLFDIETNINTIKNVNIKKEEIKKKIMLSKNTQQLMSALNCDIIYNFDDEILSAYTGVEIKIKK